MGSLRGLTPGDPVGSFVKGDMSEPTGWETTWEDDQEPDEVDEALAARGLRKARMNKLTGEFEPGAFGTEAAGREILAVRA